jgi:diaminopimelate decarboxylase
MDHFQYRNGELFVENVAITDIAERVGTPFYCYSTATLTHHVNVLTSAFEKANISPKPLICFSVKANSNIAVIATLAQSGAGADIVSGGELERALRAGVAADRIVFSGVGKTQAEMAQALRAGILRFNIESLAEVEQLSTVASELKISASIAFRVNPDIDAGTHEKISTGKAENKFGIAWEDAESAYDRASQLPYIQCDGIDIHIGSQITQLDPFARAFAKLADLLERLRKNGHNIASLDLGGGLGVPYERDNQPPPNPDAYAQIIADQLGGSGCQIILEPGRVIAANAGILVSRLIREKRGQVKNFMIVDAAMTELMRPTLYGAHHDIRPVIETDGEPVMWDIVGPVCESGDFLGKDRSLPPLAPDSLIAIFTVGAYGAVLGSTYNTRPLAPEVLVKGDKFEIIRQRPEVDDLLRFERLPNWLET